VELGTDLPDTIFYPEYSGLDMAVYVGFVFVIIVRLKNISNKQKQKLVASIPLTDSNFTLTSIVKSSRPF
jgi:hypothetical protein